MIIIIIYFWDDTDTDTLLCEENKEILFNENEETHSA